MNTFRMTKTTNRAPMGNAPDHFLHSVWHAHHNKFRQKVCEDLSVWLGCTIPAYLSFCALGDLTKPLGCRQGLGASSLGGLSHSQCGCTPFNSPLSEAGSQCPPPHFSFLCPTFLPLLPLGELYGPCGCIPAARFWLSLLSQHGCRQSSGWQSLMGTLVGVWW